MKLHEEPVHGFLADLDGFLIDTMSPLIEGYQLAAEELANVSIETDWLALFGGVSDRDFERVLKTRFGEDFPYESVKDRQREIVTDRFESEGIKLQRGADGQGR